MYGFNLDNQVISEKIWLEQQQPDNLHLDFERCDEASAKWLDENEAMKSQPGPGNRPGAYSG